MATWTQADLDTICRAIAEGALIVYYQDRDGGQRRVQYQSRSELIQTKRMIERDLGLVPDRPNRRVAQHSKGLR